MNKKVIFTKLYIKSQKIKYSYIYNKLKDNFKFFDEYIAYYPLKSSQNWILENLKMDSVFIKQSRKNTAMKVYQKNFIYYSLPIRIEFLGQASCYYKISQRVKIKTINRQQQFVTEIAIKPNDDTNRTFKTVHLVFCSHFQVLEYRYLSPQDFAKTIKFWNPINKDSQQKISLFGVRVQNICRLISLSKDLIYIKKEGINPFFNTLDSIYTGKIFDYKNEIDHIISLCKTIFHNWF